MERRFENTLIIIILLSVGFTIFGDIFANVTIFSPTIKVTTFLLLGCYCIQLELHVFIFLPSVYASQQRKKAVNTHLLRSGSASVQQNEQ